MMPASSARHIDIGKRGEQLAALYLEQNGYRILHRNYRSGHAELDIIATDELSVIFCEVKARCTRPDLASPYGRPSRAVNKEKQRNLSMAARAYLKEFPQEGKRLRFDVIEIYLRQGSEGRSAQDILKLHHIRNAFFATPLY